MKTKESVLETAIKHMRLRAGAFAFWKENGIDAYSNIVGSFFDYGLELAFQKASEHVPGHFRYLLSTGGPHEEIRFFPDGEIEFVFLDWFVGEKVPVTNEPVYQWLGEELAEMLGSLDFEAHVDELYWPEDFDDEE